jgi:hypothetical protein
MAVMPAEIRATVQLYLNGKIREWYSTEHKGAAGLSKLRRVCKIALRGATAWHGAGGDFAHAVGL